jgi:hypothetical protein
MAAIRPASAAGYRCPWRMRHGARVLEPLAARLDAGDSFSGHRLTVAARLGRAGAVAGTHRAMTLGSLLVRSAAGSLDWAIADADRRRAASRLSVARLRRVPGTARGTGAWAVRRAGIT